MEEHIYLIEDTYADYSKYFINEAKNKKEALEKFWKDFDVDWQNKRDKENGCAPRTKKQFEITDITKQIKDCTIGID